MTDPVAPEEPLSEGGFRYSDRAAVLCRTCLRLIAWETRTEPGYLPRTGWYDDARSDPIICFKAVSYRHEPLTDREWAYYEAGQRSITDRDEADSYDNHDRRILEDADAGLVDKQIVVVRCPHRIGLAYQGSPAPGMEDDWLMRLPCPCNDRSEVVATVEPVQEGCDCTELCEMGPTCPGGMLAGLPGSGCARTRVIPPADGGLTCCDSCGARTDEHPTQKCARVVWMRVTSPGETGGQR